MHPAVALALVVVAGIGVTRLWRSRSSPGQLFRLPAALDRVFATGAPFVLLGVLLGPILSVFDARGMRMLAPLSALGIGWVGASFGARLEWRLLRSVSARTWGIAAILAAPIFGVTALAAWSLTRFFPALAAAWKPPLASILTIAAAAVTSASWPGPKLGRRTALFDTIFGAALAAIALALYPRHGTVRSVILTLLASGGLTVLFVSLVSWQEEPTEGGVAIEVFGVILCGAGFSYAAGLSPFLVCALLTAGIVSFAPPFSKHVVQSLLLRWEIPLYAAFLIVAGALLHPLTVWLLPAALALAIVRVATRWVSLRYGAGEGNPLWPSLPGALPPQIGSVSIRQGASAIALAAGFDFVRGDGGGGGGPVLTTVLLSVLAAEAIAAFTPLTVSPRQAEVT